MSYWYLGSPYSKYPGGLDAAFDEICRIAAVFARSGISAYSPIAHTHPIAKAGNMDPFDHKIWLPFDEPMMVSARGLVVVKMVGWEDSFGLQQEIIYFKSASKPIRYLDPEIALAGEPYRLLYESSSNLLEAA